MKIIALSDTHNQHRNISVPDGDVLIHAGDSTRNGTYPELEDFLCYTGYGRYESDECRTVFVNASCCTEKYKAINTPQILEINL